jgi:hypothetical protein
MSTKLKMLRPGSMAVKLSIDSRAVCCGTVLLKPQFAIDVIGVQKSPAIFSIMLMLGSL